MVGMDGDYYRGQWVDDSIEGEGELITNNQTIKRVFKRGECTI